MQLDIPEGKDAIEYVWGEMVPRIGPAASKFSGAVYSHSTLDLREFEEGFAEALEERFRA